MCGIAGIITSGGVDVPALGRMADAMARRGPGGEGIWRDRVVFASSVWALRAADPSLAVPDAVAMERFLALGKTPQLPATFYADVERLPPAHLAVWTPGGGLKMRRWWEPRRVDVPRDAA